MNKTGPLQMLQRLLGRKKQPDLQTTLQTEAKDMNKTLAGLANAFSETLQWRLDDRFAGALAELDEDAQETALAAIGEHLPHQFDSASIKKAPKAIKTAVQNYGGLQAGQQLFTTHSGDDVLLLGLWWPWSNGVTVSVRLIPHAPDHPEKCEAALAVLRDAFRL